MWASLVGPTGSGWASITFGSVARSANRFTTTTPPQPQIREKPITFRRVASSCEESAVLGLRQTKTALGASDHRRHSL